MKISKRLLKRIIKEELEKSEKDLVSLAREQVSIIDVQRAIERGDFGYLHAAAALRKLADEFETAGRRKEDKPLADQAKAPWSNLDIMAVDPDWRNN